MSTKIIILAAGQGTRLRPYTDILPKCMVEYNGNPLLHYILKNIDEKISKKIIVTGYKSEVISNFVKEKNVYQYHNDLFDTTNMVYSFFKAIEEFDSDVIISYSDIIYKKEILDILINSKNDISVVIDKNWKKLWEIRMDNPLEDAETLKIEGNNIVEIGKKAKSIDEIQGQYIGLVKFSKHILPRIKDFYFSLDKNTLYDGKNFDNMYMTSFLQLIIDNVSTINPVFIESGWMEIDSVEDLARYKKIEYMFDYFN